MKGLTLDEVALQMGCGFDLGDWFVMLEAEVRRESDSRPFAGEKARLFLNGRRVILAGQPSQPAVRVYARSSDATGSHKKHTGCQDSCQIDLRGDVPLHVPCTIKSRLVSASRWSCTEIDEVLLNFLRELQL
jgi:hypothetical protein